MIRLCAIAMLLTSAQLVCGQSVPTPAPAQEGRIILFGGTAHIGDGNVIPNSAIAFEQGKILWVQDADRIRLDRESATIVDISGQHVYPGLIAPNTGLGLSEIGAVRATRDASETGGFNPNARAIIAYNTDSRVTPTVRSNGILIAQVIPSGGRISGTSAVVQLDAWNWEDAVIKANDGIFVNWPNMFRRAGWWAEPGPIERNKEYSKQLDELRSFCLEARAYADLPAPKVKNLKLESMRAVFNGQSKLYFRANDVKSILAIIELTDELGVTPVIVGGRDAYRIPEELKSRNIPVILHELHSRPRFPESDIDDMYKTPKLLKDAGVQFCLSMNGFWEQRNLPFVAGTAAAYGLTREEALQSITLDAARILGIDERLGTLEADKDATLIVSTGDILDMRSSNVVRAYIGGRQIDLGNKQKDLNAKYREKYGLE